MNAAESASRAWLQDIVVGEGFCPFASAVPSQAIQFIVCSSKDTESALMAFAEACQFLEATPSTETSLVIFDQGFRLFDRYLELLEYAEALLVQMGYEGIFQIASFHPHYVFEGSDENDAANFTNRSPYPMLHLLRESSLTQALSSVEDADAIPENNIQHARSLGNEYFINILNNYKSS